MNIKSLQKKIMQLENKLAEKDAILKSYKEEVSKTNARLELLLDRFENEIGIANKIHELFVPTTLPKIPGFSFSSKFKASPFAGGDYFEIIQQEDKYRFSIVLSCSSGYSMSALFLSVLLKTGSKLNTKKSFLPSDFITFVHKEIKANLNKNDMSSLLFITVDRKKNELTYAGCGNIFFCHQNKSNTFNEVELEPALISKEKLKFSKGSLSLSPDDRIVIASSGFIEQENTKKKSYGKKNILKTFKNNKDLKIHQLRNEFFIDLERFAEKRAPARDLTLIAVDVKSNVVKLSLK